MATPATLDLARTHLSLPPNAPASLIPPAYIDELDLHLRLCPYDTLFRVAPEPQKGFGTVTCLEAGCDNLAIPLIRRVKVKDGGIRDGLGSLASYRTHIEAHATHKRSRLARIRSDTAPRPTAAPVAVRRFRFATIKTPIPKRSSLVRVTPRPNVKPEPVESTIPRKRLSDAAFKVEDTNPLKKLKQEQEKVPLALVNRNTLAKKEPVPAPIPAVDIEQVRLNIASTQVQISRLEALHDRMQRKKKKTRTDITRMAHHVAEVQRLRKVKADYDATLPRATSPLKRTGSKAQIGKTESLPKLFPPFYNPAAAKPKAEPFSLKLPPSPYGVKPVQHNAVASSSKGFGARALPDIASDDEMEVDPVITLNKYRNAIPDIPVLAGEDHNDANGDYHGRGRDTFLGPQAKADDIDKFLIEAGNSEFFDGNESIEKALEKLGLQSTHELLPSLDIPLMPHQLLCVAWMVDNEKKKSVKGGCLADEMGLGKTVQAIACMCKNPSEDPSCKTTLIVAPLALMTQWNQEISTKTNANWKVLIYHGSPQPKKKADLLKYDIVLTTYATMASEWPDFEADEKKKLKKKKAKKVAADDFIVSDSDDSGSERPKGKGKSKKQQGLLFQVDFYRIILDEAQNIRNKRTRASRAVTELSSIYRWCLTATPIVNSLVDVYGYIRFLKIRPWYDWAEFNGHVGRLEKKRPDLAVTRLQAIFQHFLMRRMKTTELDGKRLIELPEKTVELVSLEFSKEERDIYSQVESMQQAKFNKYLKAGTVLKNYASVLVMLLRLRQLCSHPALIQENGTHFLAPDEADEPEEYRDELARARAIMPPNFVKDMKLKFKEATLRRMEAEKESQDAAADVDDCPICFDVLTAAVITRCGHQFCKDCLNEVFETPLPEQGGNANGYICKANERPCPACRTPISVEQVFASAAFQPTEKDLEDDVKAEGDSDIEMLDVMPAKTTSKDKGKGKSQAKRPARKSASKKFIVLDSSDVETDVDSDPEDDAKDSDMSDFIVESDEDEEEKDARAAVKKRLGKRRAVNVIIDSDDENVDDTPLEKEVLFGAPKKKLTKEEVKLMPRFLPSTKMKEMMDVLVKLAEEHPDEKTLIISQWTGCLTIVSDYLNEAGIVHVKYQGDMNTTKRETAIQVFMSKDKARVMLMSAKCGGVGLNLTRANNVISLDLGWSPAMDHQAFDRVHRLGQHRPVIVKRMVIANTVEDRILALQERKQSLADGSLGEGAGKKIGRLSVRELANLFGLDARGRVLAK
ncbi:SNF2 superfamily protein, partial [Mycena filopes]